MVTFGRQLYAVIAKDMLIERRTKDAVSAMLIFSLLVLVTFNFALDLRVEIMSAVGPAFCGPRSFWGAHWDSAEPSRSSATRAR